MASETQIQEFVHKLEEGGWAKWIRRGVVVAFCLFIINLWMFRDNGFKGLSHQHAIDHAQVSREIARGNGFTTKVIRPAALWQFTQNRGTPNVDRTPDTFNAPINPIIGAIAFKVAEGISDAARSIANALGGSMFANFPRLFVMEKEMTPKVVIYAYDKVIACVQFFFLLVSVLVSYLTIKRLFDKRLAVLVAWLLLLCQTLWNFAISGLPQNEMLFFFACAMYLMVRALEARNAAQRTWPWLAGTGATFALLVLTHGLAIWIFFGALAFCLIMFTPRWLTAVALIGAFAILYMPWMLRVQRASGHPFGVAWMSVLHQIRGTESLVMRSMQPPLKDVSPWQYRAKLQSQILAQFNSIYFHLGGIIVAPLFFVALMHLFKRPETAAFRWAILLMWLAALLGMAVIGMDDLPAVAPFAPRVFANDLHILFVPLMSAYGLALLLVLWSRLEINVRLVRFAFLGLIFFISAAPFMVQFISLNSRPAGRVQWPPYVPPFISILNQWTLEKEIIASDMPWAVAWYADRKSLWVPMSTKDFEDLNDYNHLNGRLVGLYLTPITGNKSFIHEIVKGEYKEWAPFIMRNLTGSALKDFPLRAVTAMPIDNECVFYSDRDRWTARED